MGHVSVQEFLNKYNILDAILRDVAHGDESKGMVSLYKDTLDDPEEQLKLRTMNKLRNEIAHGVFPSNEPIKVDSSFIDLLDKHINYVKTHQKEVARKMRISMERRREKDERERVSLPQRNSEVARTPSRQVSTKLPFKNIILSDITGVLTIEDGDRFFSDLNSSINNDTLRINDFTGVGKIVLPPGEYELLSINDFTGTIEVTAKHVTFKNIQRNDFTGTLDM